ncbi:adenosylcobinamide-GDP ribazoletransferase [Labrys monachus]|uniref:Adenosylcobinamide-GDP ribazoletransferase n=1 Tax=Labrys monachus TaxID=217067 RepID=A0ABU0FJ03_9HYPH|nr:adenosylcobinamide-GDP ribazoletransferase [Labrys monachus]MDQ0394322.1 adenosylcobinamide-GDP ribazoletransferase [Labrys monachus]
MRQLLAQVTAALRFWSRLPVPVLSGEADPHGPPDMERLAPVLPLAGAVLGLGGAVALLAGCGVGLPPVEAAILAVAAMAVVTGAMHEDGLADVADGFGGGRTPARKLEIMRDSRIGAYGATALMLAIAARISILGDLVHAAGPVAAALVLMGGAGVSRIAGLLPLAMLPPARTDGAGAASGRLSRANWGIGAALGFALAALLAYGATRHPSSLAAPAFGFLAAYGVTRLAKRQIGGQTGDVCGAATVLAEIAFAAAVLAPLGR